MGSDFLENLSVFFMKLATFFVKLAVFFVVIYLIGIRLFDFGHRLFYEKSLTSEEDATQVVFEIKQEDTVDTIAENLEKSGLIDDKLAFKFRAKIYKTIFNPNVYNLNTSMTIKNMLDIFDSPTSENIVIETSAGEVYQLASEEDDESVEQSE